MSGRRALVAGDSEIPDGIDLRNRRATAVFRPDAVLRPRPLRWVRSLLPGEEGTAWRAEVISCLAETPIPAHDANTCAVAGGCRSWSGPARRPMVRYVAPASVGVEYGSVK